MSYRIYCYTNKQTNQKYVGCTCRRYQSERSGKNGYRYIASKVFYEAIQKYGWENFVYSVLEENLTKDESEIRERYWILQLDTIYPNGYNLQSGGVSGKKYHNLISEHMSESLKGKTGWNKGIKLTDEHKQHVSESLKGLLWWNNGIVNCKSKTCPGEGFVRGRI